MKKFVIKLISYVVVLIILTLTINAVYMKMNKADSDYTEKFSCMPEKIMVCNTGSSHGLYGFNYSDIEDEVVCFNFGLASQYPSYDYRLLYEYQDNIAEGCTVFIPISYFSFLGKPEIEREEFELINRRYYKILSKDLIKQYDKKQDFYTNFPALTDGGVSLFYVLLGKSLQEGHPEWNQTADDIDLSANAEATALGHLVTNKIDDSGNYIFNEEEYNAIYDIIELCKKNNWRPVLITVPFLEEYSSIAWSESPDYMGIFYDLINKITEDTGVEYYDYSLDERFSENHELFMNGDHMNREGARQFTDILFDEVVNK